MKISLRVLIGTLSARPPKISDQSSAIHSDSLHTDNN